MKQVTRFTIRGTDLDGLTTGTGLFRPSDPGNGINTITIPQHTDTQQLKISQILFILTGVGNVTMNVNMTNTPGMSLPIPVTEACQIYRIPATASPVSRNCMFQDDADGRRMRSFLFEPDGSITFVTTGITTARVQVVWSYSAPGEAIY